MAEGTQGLLKVGSNASVTAYKSAGENTYSAAFLSTTSSTLPFQGNLEAALTMTPDSGVEGEYAVGATMKKVMLTEHGSLPQRTMTANSTAFTSSRLMSIQRVKLMCLSL